MVSNSHYVAAGKRGENFFQAFWLSAVTPLQRTEYVVLREGEVGRGRFDVCLIPKKPSSPGIVLEFGYVAGEPKKESTIERNLKKLAVDKLAQAEKYENALKSHCSEAHLFGLAFYKSRVVVTCKTVSVK